MLQNHDRRRPFRGRRFLAACLSLVCLLSGGVPVRAAESFGGASSSVKRSQSYCGLQEHVHTDKCYSTQTVLVCGQSESQGHIHDLSCYVPRTRLGCGLVEGEGHVHTDACYTEIARLICPLIEDGEHLHTDECYQTERVLSCTLPEQPGHTHSAACYVEDATYLCGHENDPSHVHTLACYAPGSLTLICGKAEGAAHTHTPYCYQEQRVLNCILPVHTHSAACYSGTGPLVENEGDWRASVASAKLNGDWNHDILEIAKTQLGYAPDGSNVSIGSDGSVRYYSRYGDWYADTPELIYEDWCLMFVSFCIHYAGIDGLPYGCGCPDWLKLVDASLFHPYGDGYTPKPGDIVLFTYGRKAFREENAEREELGMDPLPESSRYVIPEHAGVLVSMNSKAFRTIEGNNGPVGYHSYSFGSGNEPGAEELLYGYVSIPSNPHVRSVTDYTGHCTVTADFSGFVVPHVREPIFSEYQRWESANDPADLILGWGVNFVDGIELYTPTGVLQYSFRFDLLPEKVKVTFLGPTELEEIPCTVDGNTVSFSTDRVGTFIFSKG